MATEARHITVQGRVQGVGFRYFVLDAARRSGLVGSVRNCDDGSVEIVVEGSAGRVRAFVNEVGRGPALARVDKITACEIPPSGTYTTFNIEGW